MVAHHGDSQLTQWQRICLLRQELQELLLLLLSRFSRVRLCATPQTAAHQAPPSLGFSTQEHWSGLPFLLQCMKVKSESEVAQSCPTLRDPTDCSLPNSAVHGISQARVLEWVAVAFSRDAGDAGSIPGSGRSPRIGNGNPFQDSCLKKSHGQRNLVCYSPWNRKESDNN